MVKGLKHISLFRIITGMFIGFLLLALTNYIVIKNYVVDISSSADKIEAANQTKVLSQKILLLAAKLESNAGNKNELLNAMDEHDIIFKAFQTGGIVPFNNTFIEPLEGKNRMVLNQSIQYWDSIKFVIHKFIESPSLQTTNSNDQIFLGYKSFLERNSNKFLDSNSRLAQQLIATQKKQKENLNWVLLGFLLFNSVCIIIVLFATKRFIFKPLEEVATKSKRLAQGEVGIQIEYRHQNEIGDITTGINQLSDSLDNARLFVEKIEKGELNQKDEDFDSASLHENSIERGLIKMRDQMRLRSREDEVRNWTTQGLAKFVDILRASDNIRALGDAILSNLTDYTNSNQAGLYLLNDNEESNRHLELISLYAFNSKKFEEKTFRLGEGLVGQTFLEKKTLYFLEVPEDYISITSGLGDANPKSLLLVPLKVEDEVYGVIEIASFNEYEEYQIQFIEKLSENIASTISTVKTNEKTKILLEESQQLTEQMQAQEEEMRQNMEELTATQEEMARKETAVNAQLEAINISLGIAEYDLNGYVLSSNGKYNEALGYSEQSMNDASFNKLHGQSTLLEEINVRGQWSGWLNKVKSNGESVELKSHFVLAKDENGEGSKIIEIISQFEKEESVSHQSDLSHIDEIEEELQQNLDALEITQEQLSEKLNQSKSLLKGLMEVSNVIIYNQHGEILEISDHLKDNLGDDGNLNNYVKQPISELTQESTTLSLTLVRQKNIKIQATIIRYDTHKEESRFLMIWV